MNGNTQTGVVEAFSFQKGVVKISGVWITFGTEAEQYLRDLQKGDRVEYVANNKRLEWIQKAQQQQQYQAQRQQQQYQAPRQQYQAPAQTPAPDGRSPNMSKDELIVRQVALKAAVDLARTHEMEDTNYVTDVAGVFLQWIMEGKAGLNIELHMKKEGKQDGKKCIVKNEDVEAML